MGSMKRALAIILSLLLMLPLSAMPTLVATADAEGRVLQEIPLKGTVSKTLSGNGYVCAPFTSFASLDLSGYDYADLAVEIDLYLEGDVAAFKSGINAYLEVTSSGTCDQSEINWNLAGIEWQADSWFRTTLKFSAASQGSTDPIDLKQVNYARMYIYAPGGDRKAYTFKYCNFRIVDLSKGAVGTDLIGDGSFKVAAPEWELVNTTYDTTEAVIAGYNLGDYLEPNTDRDATATLQTLLDAMGAAGGGTVFVPAGTYTFKGTLLIPYGVTLQGDWRAPTEEEPGATGTIFKIYSGKGDTNGTAFITTLPNSCVQGLTFWYPEQDAENIVEYPLTIQMYKSGNWGADYVHVRNCTFINSYRAVQQGPDGNGCPNVYNVYGTPLYVGLHADNLGDIGRFDYIHFSPFYWENCGLAGAPTTDTAKKALEDHLLANATALRMGRVDWSYWAFSDIEGYGIGLHFVNSESNPGTYGNGHVYGMNFKNCGTAICFDGVSTGAAEVLSNITIEGCKIGIYTNPSQESIGNLSMSYVTIDADTAIRHDGNMRFFVNTFTILRGGVEASAGPLVVSGSTFHTAAPQMTLKKGVASVIVQGNRATEGEFEVNNIGLCPVEISDKEVALTDIDWMTADQAKDETVKAAREVLYVAELDATGKADVTANLQVLLDKAGQEGGGYVFVPGGHYRLNGSLTVPSGVELCGAVDVGRNPYEIGTIFDVYGRQEEATVILSANSGLRGIVFDYPEQGNTVATLKTYPYAVQGRGENVYIVNFAIRNGYDGVDLMSYRCDNHYVKYLAGYCFHSVMKIGGGSVGGKVINYQMNCSSWWNGDESKYGTWDNWPTEAEKTENTGGAWLLNNVYVQTNCVVLTVGDVTDQVLYDNFSYLGAVGAYYVEENGQAADGWNVGNAYDYSTVGIKVDAIEDMDFINVQIVSYNYTGQVEDTHHMYLTDQCDDTVNVVNVACWAQPNSYVRADSGTINIYCATFTENAKSSNFATIGQEGYINLQNGAITNLGVPSLAQTNLQNLTVEGYVNEYTMAGESDCKWGANMVRVARWDTPQNATIDTTQKMYMAEAFTDYATETVGDVANVLSISGTFNALSAISVDGNVTLANDDGNEMMRLFHNGRVASVYARNAGLRMTNGRSNDSYMLETRLNIKSLRDHESAQVALAVYSMTNTSARSATSLVAFRSDGVYVNEEKLTSYTADTWYRVQIAFDLTDISNKTYTVTLLDDDYTVLAASEVIPFGAGYQDNTNDVGVLEMAAKAGIDETAARSTEVLMDYVVVTKDPSEASTVTVGDVNGDGKVNTTDARFILQYAAEKIGADKLDMDAADVDGKNSVNTTDARMILQYAAEKIPGFPRKG